MHGRKAEAYETVHRKEIEQLQTTADWVKCQMAEKDRSKSGCTLKEMNRPSLIPKRGNTMSALTLGDLFSYKSSGNFVDSN